MSGLFGDQFDYDHDGDLDAYERAEEYAFYEMLHEDDADSDDSDDDCGCGHSGGLSGGLSGRHSGGHPSGTASSGKITIDTHIRQESSKSSGKMLIGGFLLVVGLEAFIYFPVFAVIIIVLAVAVFMC